MANFGMNSNAEKVLSELENKIQDAFLECGLDAQYWAKAACPVKTGRLRNSITFQTDIDGMDSSMTIGTNVEYGIFVENGTSRMKKARPFIKPSIADHREHYKQVIMSHLKD